MAAMFETLVKVFVYGLTGYAGLGLLLAAPFVWFGSAPGF